MAYECLWCTRPLWLAWLMRRSVDVFVRRAGWVANQPKPTRTSQFDRRPNVLERILPRTHFKCSNQLKCIFLPASQACSPQNFAQTYHSDIPLSFGNWLRPLVIPKHDSTLWPLDQHEIETFLLPERSTCGSFYVKILARQLIDEKWRHADVSECVSDCDRSFASSLLANEQLETILSLICRKFVAKRTHFTILTNEPSTSLCRAQFKL